MWPEKKRFWAKGHWTYRATSLRGNNRWWKACSPGNPISHTILNRSNLPINRQVKMHKMFSNSSQTDSPMKFIAPLRRTLHSTTPNSHAKGHPFNATRTVLLRAYLRTYTLAASGQAFCPQLRLRTRRIRYTLHESCFQSPFLNCKKRRSKNRILSYPPKRSSIEPHSYHYSHFYLFITD